MDLQMPGCSSNENDELSQILTEGINVWGANQETLEEQALKELEIFASESKNTNRDELEEGEIESETTESDNKPDASLVINNYIKRQEELKKSQLYKKALQDSVSDHNTEIANKICKKEKVVHKKKKISKISTNNDNISAKCDINSDSAFKESDSNVIEVHSGSEYSPSDEEFDSDYEPDISNISKNDPNKVVKYIKPRARKTKNIKKVRDDGIISDYQERLDIYYKKVEEELELKAINNTEDEFDEDVVLKDGLKIPMKIWANLYSYQQDGVRWLWKLHRKPTGGLLGDEMGLGKTVEIIAFLTSLEHSKIPSINGRIMGLGASIVVSPATVIHQWVQHFHEWSPELRVAVLHQSGTFRGNKAKLIQEINKCHGILVTTYQAILKYKGNLLDHYWHYLILDEGHKIRNPSAKVSVAVKLIRTPHRILLTGSPMQNNLTELWSLFDFTNPGMLGNLATFTEHFANPILQGGFANANPIQEATALSVATTLKNIISPYLLRRMKSEVQHNILLPSKNEQVLFCSLGDQQRHLYKDYLMSDKINSILGRGTKNWFADKRTRGNVLVAVTTLRKICNHPDLFIYDSKDECECDENTPASEKYGFYKKSGKMIVVSALLKIWKKQKHRVLLFTQGRAMITVFQDFFENEGYKYLKMDGQTPVSSRQPLIDKFNQDESYDVFLLTTRVGGLGVNLTGANRVIIFDPDWNPATDTQARERAWRIGQEKQVTVYRLLSAGTIEEKMYQRQVWKQLLSNKVLIDPKTHRLFKSSDLHDLFSLQESPNADPETANIFHESRVKIQENLKNKMKARKKKKPTETATSEEVKFSDDKIEAMKNLAQRISKSMSAKNEEKKDEEKWFYQKVIEEERHMKLEEKAKLKQMSAAELFQYNKMKALQKEDDTINKVDDQDTNVSFSKALEYTEVTAKLYHKLDCGKVHVKEKKLEKNNTDERKSRKRKLSEEQEEGCSNVQPEKHKKKKHKSKNADGEKVIIDISRKVDGEEVEGLVRSETKKKKKDKKLSKNSDEVQDNFVLEQLFSKKGVSGALEHESILKSSNKPQSLKVHSEATKRADESLKALRKSRLDNWKW